MARLEMTSGVLVQGVYLKGGGAESLLDLMTWDKFDYQLFHILVDENKDESDEEFTYIAAAEDKPTADELVDQWANLSKILTTDEDKRDKNFYTVMNLIAKARYVLNTAKGKDLGVAEQKLPPMLSKIRETVDLQPYECEHKFISKPAAKRMLKAYEESLKRK